MSLFYSSAGKVMALVFWDAEGILFVGYFEKGKTITGEYYSNILTKLNEKKIVRKDPVCKKKNYLSLEQCTRPQNCFGNGKIKESEIRIFGTSTLFPRFGSF
jgi:hypothetical protein